MLTDLYVSGSSYIHHTAPHWKLGFVFTVCTALFFLQSWPFLIAISLLVGGLYYVARIPQRVVMTSLRPLWVVLVVLFCYQVYAAGVSFALYITIRLVVMVLVANLLTFTTLSSDLISSLENALGKIVSARSSEALGLAFSLTFRFIPKIHQIFKEVQEAQKARGLEGNWVALMVPLILRTLMSVDEMAQAISVRNIDVTHLINSEDSPHP